MCGWAAYTGWQTADVTALDSGPRARADWALLTGGVVSSALGTYLLSLPGAEGGLWILVGLGIAAILVAGWWLAHPAETKAGLGPGDDDTQVEQSSN
jgi:hypothetical protein